MKNVSIVAILISLISISSGLQAVRSGQKRGPERNQQAAMQDSIGQANELAPSEPTLQKVKQVEEQLDRAQDAIAQGAIVQTAPQKIAETTSFIIAAKELLACSSPTFLGGKSCDEKKVERLKAELRAQLPKMDRQLLMKLGIGAATLAGIIVLLYKGVPVLSDEMVLQRYASSKNLDLIKNYANKLPGQEYELDSKKAKFYAKAAQLIRNKRFGEGHLQFISDMVTKYPVSIERSGAVRIEE